MIRKHYRFECIDGQTNDADKRNTLLRLACELEREGDLCSGAVSGGRAKARKLAGIVVGSIAGGVVLGLAIYYAHRRVKLNKFLLQFDQTTEDKQLVLDDPDEWSNTGYFPFEGEERAYNSSSLLTPMSSSG